MNLSKLFVAALVATAVGASAQDSDQFDIAPGEKYKADPMPETPRIKMDLPVPAPAITLSGVTGTVQIKTAGGIMTVKAGEPIPVIPAGSEIVVVSGDVSVKAGGVTVKAGAGDSFTVNTNGAAVSIAVTGGSVSVTGADGKAKDVKKGEGVTVASAAPTPAPTKTATKTEEPAAPDSIPSDPDDYPTIITPQQSSPTQETGPKSATVSPSAP